MNVIGMVGQYYRMAQDIIGTIGVYPNSALAEHKGAVIEKQQRQ